MEAGLGRASWRDRDARPWQGRAGRKGRAARKAGGGRQGEGEARVLVRPAVPGNFQSTPLRESEGKAWDCHQRSARAPGKREGGRAQAGPATGLGAELHWAEMGLQGLESPRQAGPPRAKVLRAALAPMLSTT